MKSKTLEPFDAFLMITLILFWGSSFVVVKIALGEGLTPIAIATFRFLVAGGLFIVVLLLNRARKADYQLGIERRDIPTVVVLALTGVTFFFAAQYTGIQMAGASIAAILVCLLSPILISILSARIFKDRLTKKQVLGIMIAAAGTLIVVAGGTLSFQTNSSFLVGSIILLSTPILWATYSLLGKKLLEKYDAFLIVSYINVLGGLFLIPFSMAENSFHLILSLTAYEWLAVLFLAATCSVLGYFIWFFMLKRVNAASVSSFLFAEPLVTVSFAVAFVGETLSIFTIAGGLLIFAGVYLVTKK
ncbi:MAG TPA: DMT family transporter [Candidatus Acidoferrum sp.]|jgi:drug/metabolite transporter (DMT)-like permease|nr:DMT family transporter [Candidatus Acidoferrum sp.]